MDHVDLVELPSNARFQQTTCSPSSIFAILLGCEGINPLMFQRYSFLTTSIFGEGTPGLSRFTGSLYFIAKFSSP